MLASEREGDAEMYNASFYAWLYWVADSPTLQFERDSVDLEPGRGFTQPVGPGDDTELPGLQPVRPAGARGPGGTPD